MLVASDLDAIERLDAGHRAKADEWRDRLAEYGKTLVTPPAGDYDSADVIQLRDEKSAWSVWYRLWTAEEGQSDLGIELTVRLMLNNAIQIEVDDLLVA